MASGKIIPIQLMKGSKVVPLTPDEYARHQQQVLIQNTLTWVLTCIAAFLFLTTFTVKDQRVKGICVFSALAVAIASRLSSGENVRADRIAKDHTDGSDVSRQSRIFQQTSIEQVPVESWYEAMEEEESSDEYPHDLLCKPYDRDYVDRLVLNRNSKLIVGAPGCGKTVTGKAMISALFSYFENAIMLVNYRKVTSFCGLESIPGCCAQSRQGDLEGLFNQMALLHAIHQSRSNMPPSERENQPPAILYLVDYAATWNNMETILKDRKHKLYKAVISYLERMGEIVTVGRENNVQMWVDSQSFNLLSLGNIDANERGCLTTLALGFESLDKFGQVSGNYEVLQLLLRNAFMVSSDADREQLTTWLPLMKEHSQESRQPLAFTTLGGAELFFLPDYRFFERFILPQETLQRASITLQKVYSEFGESLDLESMILGSDVSELGSDDSEPGSGFNFGSDGAEPLNRSPRASVQGSVQSSDKFTTHQLSPLEAWKLISELQNRGYTQTQIIETLWDCKKGGNKKYLNAKAEYDFLIQTDPHSFDE